MSIEKLISEFWYKIQIKPEPQASITPPQVKPEPAVQV